MVMAVIETITLEVADPTAADRFYTTAFGLDPPRRAVPSTEASGTGHGDEQYRHGSAGGMS
jgi:catechol 2,3-dioxygenase-like lactoylglutathione lyase family enzyme